MARKLKVDMTGVESYTRCPEGEHLVRVKKMDMGTVQGSGDDCLKAVFEVLEGDGKGCQVFETFSLGEKALWKLKQFLVAIGMKADGKLNLDLDKLEGKICVIDVIHDEYNGTKRAKISSYMKPTFDDSDEDEDEDEDDNEDEEPKKPVKKLAPKKPVKKQPEPADDEDDDDEEDEEEPPKKPSKKANKKAAEKLTKKAKQPEPEDDDDDDDWEEDDD